jgi:hypothetical protein
MHYSIVQHCARADPMMGGIVQLALLLGGASAARRRLDDASCYDDASWYIGGSPHKDCGYLSKKEHLCAKKDQATKTVGYEACPYACGLCDEGTDSTSWYASGKPKNDCDWIVGFRRPSVRARHDPPPRIGQEPGRALRQEGRGHQDRRLVRLPVGLRRHRRRRPHGRHVPRRLLRRDPGQPRLRRRR